jgi:hypothetical protein
MHKTVTFTFIEMFDKVWETPVLRLAHEIGVSDVALSKACRKAGIPLPTRGHWAKPESKRPSKPKRPSMGKGVSFDVLDRTGFPVKSAIEVRGHPAPPPIEVPSVLSDPHVLVATWLKSVKSEKTNEGYLSASDKPVTNLQVSPALMERAALLLDTLIKASQAQGHLWKISTNHKMTALVDGESIVVGLRERLEKRELHPPPAPKRSPSRQWEPSLRFTTPTIEWSSTGELTLSLSGTMNHGVRKNWKDTKTGRLEAKLSSAVEGLTIASASGKALRDEWAKAAQERDEQAKIRLENARVAEAQARLQARLIQNTKKWEQAQRLRMFIHATRERLAANPEANQQSGQKWLDWATVQADALDPTADLYSVTSLHVDIETWFTGQMYGQQKKDWWSS